MQMQLKETLSGVTFQVELIALELRFLKCTILQRAASDAGRSTQHNEFHF